MAETGQISEGTFPINKEIPSRKESVLDTLMLMPIMLGRVGLSREMSPMRDVLQDHSCCLMVQSALQPS